MEISTNAFLNVKIFKYNESTFLQHFCPSSFFFFRNQNTFHLELSSNRTNSSFFSLVTAGSFGCPHMHIHTRSGSWKKGFYFQFTCGKFYHHHNSPLSSFKNIYTCKIFNLLCKHYKMYAWRKLFRLTLLTEITLT